MQRDLKVLRSLQRMHRLQLDEKRRQVAALQNDADRIREDAKTLESSVTREQGVANQDAEAALAYGGYAEGVIAKRRQLAAQAIEAEQKISEKTEDMKTSFLDVKRYEIIEDNRRAAYQAEDDKREQAQLDEFGAETHRRSQSKK